MSLKFFITIGVVFNHFVRGKISVDLMQSLVDSVKPKQGLIFVSDKFQENVNDIGIQNQAYFLPVQVLDIYQDPSLKTMLQEPTKGKLVIVDIAEPEVLSDILLGSPLLNLISNVWIIVGTTSYIQTVIAPFTKGFNSNNQVNTSRRMLSPNSLMFFLPNNSGDENLYKLIQIIGNAKEDPVLKPCGDLGRTCDLAVVIEITKNTMDFGGQTITMSYESWPPMVILDENGTVGGNMPRLVKQCGQVLNLTIELVKVRNPNGGRLENGTWTGDLGDISRGLIDASAWGWAPTYERAEIVEFSQILFPQPMGVVINMPGRDAISLKTYTGEFLPDAWIYTLCFSFMSWLLLFLLLTRSDAKSSVLNTLTACCSIMLRLLINKSTTLRTHTLSLRCGMFSLLMMCLLILNYYKATMKSFLTVRTFSLPIERMEDILDSHMDFVIYRYYIEELSFSLAPEGTLYHEIYHKKLIGTRRFQDFDGFDHVLEELKEGNIIYMGTLGNFLDNENYPCKIIDVKSLRGFVYAAIPFAKESPFLPSFQKVLTKMIQAGTLDKIINDNKVTYKDWTECEAESPPLSIAQTFFPFGCLALGILVAFLSSATENLPRIRRLRYRITDLNKRNEIMKAVEQRMLSMSTGGLEYVLKTTENVQ